MPRPATKKLHEDLYCPVCGSKGMREAEKSVSGLIRYRCVVSSCRCRTTKRMYQKPQILPKTKIGQIKKHKFFVITSAVNDTPIITKAHETFKNVANHYGGIYLVIPGVYKNPDMTHQGIINSYTWPEEILPHICDANVPLNNSIIVRGKTRITYTNVNPLDGMNHAGGTESEVYGHPQVSMRLVATPKNDLPKMMHTTGSISEHNYGGSQRAQKAEHHHSISALIVEVEGSKFWTHELHFDGDGAYFFGKYFTSDSVTDGHSAAGMVFGDIHARSIRKRTCELINECREKLKPEKEVYHDVHDHHIGSHHSAGDVLFYLQKALQNELCIKSELMQSVKFLSDKEGAYIVDSNHDHHLNQWFNRFKPANDAVNAPLYFELGEMARADIANGGKGNLFRLFLEKYCPVKLNFPDPNNPLYVCGIDCGQHGHKGPNGARGSIRNIAQTGYKSMTAHSHTPGIEKGCYQVGTSNTDLDYAEGLSSWLICHGIIYRNGKRALFAMIDGKLPPSLRAV